MASHAVRAGVAFALIAAMAACTRYVPLVDGPPPADLGTYVPVPFGRTHIRPTPSASVVPLPSVAPAPWVAPPLKMKKSEPVRVQIPAIGLDTELIRLGLQADGTLEVPSTGFPAGWFTGAPTPGEIGPAVIVGHVHWQRKVGVFGSLGKVNAGNQILVSRADGSVAVFVVTRVERVVKSEFPSEQVYGNIDIAGLRVITCDGYDQSRHEYEDNLIVFAKLVATARA